jgi:integrase
MRQISLSVLEYSTETKARLRLQQEVLRINGVDKYRAQNRVTMGVLIQRFIKEERIEEIAAQPPGEVDNPDGLAYSTVMSYRSNLNKHIKPAWQHVYLSDFKPQAANEWLKRLPLAPKSRAHIRGLLHLLLEKAMLWDMIELQRNPVELVRVRGSSVRVRKIHVLTPDEVNTLLDSLPEPYRTMVLVAVCTGLRVSELLALRWDHFDFVEGTLLVQSGTVNGRVGAVKTLASNDYVPLAPVFQTALEAFRNGKRMGLVFPSHKTGGCYFASEIQKDYLRPAGEKMGIRSLGWHALRHTYRTLLDETGASVGVQQKLMRHANVSTTMNIYGSSSLRARAEANSRVVHMLVPMEKPSDSAKSKGVEQSESLLWGSVGS